MQLTEALGSMPVDAAVVDFDALYESTVDFAFRVLSRMGVGEADLDDALQDVFLVAHRRLGSLRPGVRPSSWVAGIAVKVAHDYRRRAARKPGEALDPLSNTLETRDGQPERSAMVSEGVRAVNQFLTTLSPVLLEVFVLAELEQQSAPEIAEALAVPVNTVYSRVRLARGHFERFVEQLTGGGA
ncbi:MAG: sigma-70 family RNA polymerase sigma factor [Myxococcaceae bacterium]|nr:sigma-70 family RNA polymerase sigma factor [Myxococcaceae bacterium]